MTAVLVALWTAACGDGATEPAPSPNRAPVPSGTIPALTVAAGSTATVNVASYFSDPDGDALVYAATSSNPQTATVAVSGSVVTVTATARGETTVTVTASDPGGLSAQATFAVTVPNQAPVAVDSVPAQTVFVGDTVQVDMNAYFNDPDGDALVYSASSSNSTVVSTSVAGSVVSISAIGTGTSVITVTATDPDGLAAQHNFEVTVPNRAPVSVGALPAQTLAVGQTVAVNVLPHFEDPDNDSLAYTATTTDSTVAVATISENVLTVTARTRGTVSVTVTATDPGGLSAEQSFEVTVANQAPIVRDSIHFGTVGIGETRSWSGPDLFLDPDGDSLAYTARSSNLQLVRPWVTDDVLLIQGLLPGTATLTFSAFDPEGLSARIVFDVTVLGPVSISGTEPLVLLEGAPATVFGSGFSPIASENLVSVGGLLASVTAVTESSLSIKVPRADCLPPRRDELRVNVGQRSDARTVGVAPASQEDLELPQGFYRYSYAGNGCLYLPGDVIGGEYIIGVVSTSEVPSSLTPITMTSTVGDPAVVADRAPAVASRPVHQAAVEVGSLAARSRVAPRRAPIGIETPHRQEQARGGRDWELHSEIMAANEELLRRVGPIPSAMGRARRSRSISVNDTLTFFVDAEGTCSANGQVRGVVRRVGDAAVWLDDLDNPSETFTDSQLAELDAFYESHTKHVHDEYYGSLSDVDGNDRILILMTKEANRRDDKDGGFVLGGWVQFGDLLPSNQCGTSNRAEIFYGRVPDPEGVFGNASTRQATFEYYPSLLTHEIAHLVQANAVMFGGADFATWKLEGGATLSEQLVAYRLFGHGSRQNLGYAAFQQGVDWYAEWVVGLATFLGWDSDDPTGRSRIPHAPEECSWMGRPKEGNDGPCRNAFRAVYDVPSLVFRYAMDRFGSEYPTGEQGLMRYLTRSTSRGLASLTDVSNWRVEQILADFYVALWLDLNGGDAYGMATWDLDDIWSRFPESAGLRPWTSTSAAFRGNWNIRSGSTFYLRWTPGGSRGPTSLKVTSPSGAPVPGHISVWALRVR